MEYTLILLGIFIVAISRAYYLDFLNDKVEFASSIKTLRKGIFNGLVYIGILIGLKTIYQLVIPLNKNHGIEYNFEREKLGIPKIGENWENRKYSSDQFTTQWWNTESADGHFKKVINYGIINAVSEIDYYKNENKKFIYVSSKYDFDERTFEYFIEEQGKTSKINKTEFEKFLTE